MKRQIPGGKMFRLGLLLLAAVLGGCAEATVESTQRASSALPKPDAIIVTNFAVNGSEVALDRGVMTTAMRDASNRPITVEENRVGHMVSDKLAQVLVEELNNAGIPAYRGGTPGTRTLILYGEFVSIDEGNQTARVWVGFGMGGSTVRTRVQAVQNGRIVAEAQTATKSSLKPGMLASLGAGAATDAAGAVVVGAASTGVSEMFLATVEADAARTAREIAGKIRRAYIERGWLPE